jgi:hypothetical protein
MLAHGQPTPPAAFNVCCRSGSGGFDIRLRTDIPPQGGGRAMYSKPEAVRSYHKTLWMSKKFGRKRWG